jgi:hypothetical protein
MVSGNLQFVSETYTEAQTDAVLITCPTDKHIHMWMISVNTGPDSETFLKFGSTVAADFLSGSEGAGTTSRVGADNENLTVTCPANTTICVVYGIE